jgi:DNA polymerase bacteriophage-type
MMAWAFDDEEPEVWLPPHVTDFLGLELRPIPHRIAHHIEAGGEIRAWNAAFERIIWDEIMVKRYGAPAVQLDQWVCTAAEAAAMALPRSLDQAAKVVGISEKKDEEGYQLMMRMTRPRKIEDDGTLIWWYDRGRIERLIVYNKQDVRTERAMAKVLRRLVPREREIYLLDQRINDRGIHLDHELVLAAKDVVDEGVARANATLEQLTGGAVKKVTNPGAIRQWVNDQGVETDSMDKAAVRDLLSSDLSPEVRQVVELRANAGRSSIAKLDTMLEVVSEGDQLRDLLFYHAARTGRWGGRLVQPHNFPQGELPDPEMFIDAVMRRAYDEINLVAHPIVVVMALLRSMMTARPGHHLVAADYSGIEARVLNWFAQQLDILEKFANGEDVYSYNAARMTKTPYIIGVKHKNRQGGKFQELGCGFQMGWKTAKTQAATPQYGLTLSDQEAKDIVNDYRATHDKVVQLWRDSENAAFEAVATPGSVVTFGPLRNLKFTKQGGYLYLVLPSKRPLVYAAPKIEEMEKPWGKIEETVTTWGINSKTKQWEKRAMYGGLWVENFVQATARDMMAEGMLKVEAVEMPVVLDVHDEVVGEVPEDAPEDTLERFQSLLAQTPEWAAGCPIATEGWRGKRYRK